MRQAPIYIIFAGRRNLRAIDGHQLRFDICKRNRLIAVIGDDQKQREKALVAIVHSKNSSLIGHIVWIDSNGDTLVLVLIVRGIAAGRIRVWLGEFLKG